MRKKGFTLAELLAVIVVIGLLIVLVAPTIVNRMNLSRDDAKDSQNKIIFEAVNTFLDDDKDRYPGTPGNVYCVTIKQLLDKGKLVDPLKDVITNKDYDNQTTIKATMLSNNVREFSIGGKSECQEQLNKDIVFSVTPSLKKWSPYKQVRIYYPKVDGEYLNQYSIDNGKSWKMTKNSEVAVEPNFTKNGKIKAKVTVADKTNLEKEQVIDKIDNAKPIIIASKGTWKDDFTQNLTFIIKDMDSGVTGYYLTTSSTAPALNDSKWIKFPLASHGGTGTVGTSKPLGTYYMYAKDKAGNIGSTSIEVVDTIAPSCKITSKCNSAAGNCALSITAKDTGGSGLKSYGFGTYNGPKTKTVNTAGYQYGQAIDYAGNVGNCQEYIIIPPTCKLEISGTKGNNDWYRSNVNVKMTMSGTITDYGLDTKANSTNKKTAVTHTSDGSNIQYYGYVSNSAGSVSCQLAQPFKKDSTPPTKTTVDTGWYNGGWTSASVPRTFRADDATSGVDHFEYSSGCSGSKSGDEPSNYNPVTWAGTDVACQRAVDRAGNIGAWSNKVTIQIERVDISCQKMDCYPCLVDGKWIDHRWEWEWSGAASGINWGSTYLSYTTEYNVTFTYYGDGGFSGPYRAGYAEFHDSRMAFGRSYANQSIVGNVCTSAGSCKSCTEY